MLQLHFLYLCAFVPALLFPSLSLESPLEGGESLQFGSVRGILSARDSPTCYYPDGSVAADFNYTTCNLSKRERLKAQQHFSGLTNVTDSPAGFSSCCFFAEGDTCLSDGLCYWPPESDGHGNYIYRYFITPRNYLQVHPLTRFSAACTDKSWTDSACPKYCTDDTPNHFETVSFCANTTDFCCVKSVDGDCCEYPELRFNLTISSYIWAYLENGTNATTAPPSSLPSTAASFPPQTPTRILPTPTITPSVTPLPTHKSSNTGAIVGGSVGGAVALLVVTGAAWLYLRKRKKKPPPVQPEYPYHHPAHGQSPMQYYPPPGQPNHPACGQSLAPLYPPGAVRTRTHEMPTERGPEAIEVTQPVLLKPSVGNE
jgi:hypothetical protein